MKAAPLRPWAVRWASALLIWLQLPSLVASQNPAPEDPNKVKAAFLRNFAHYVTWPTQAFGDARSPWHVCILGRDPFGQVLDKTLEGRTEQERPFEIYRAATLDELPACQILFIAYDDSGKRRAALSRLIRKDRPVLTVGDAPDFLQEGGVIQFEVEDRVRMSINLDQARAVALTIQTKMLEVSHGILENGVFRQVR